MKLSSLYDTKTKSRHQGSTNIWQFWKPSKNGKKWYQNYAAKNNPQERLVQNFRGKGY